MQIWIQNVYFAYVKMVSKIIVIQKVIRNILTYIYVLQTRKNFSLELKQRKLHLKGREDKEF